MKLFRIALFAAMVVLTAGAFGQIGGDLVVDVPFAFSVAGEKLPAGHYFVKQNTGMIRIFNDHTQGALVPTHSAIRTKADGSKLVFHHYGDNYFLSAVWVTGSTSGKELYPSRAEREAKAQQKELEMAVVRPAQ